MHHQEFFTVHTAMVLCHTGLLTAYEQDQDGTGLDLREPNQFCPGPARKLSANLYDIQPLLCEQ